MRQHYKTERVREEREVMECPEIEEEECYQVLKEYGITREVPISTDDDNLMMNRPVSHCWIV